jgi:hypothetical protein
MEGTLINTEEIRIWMMDSDSGVVILTHRQSNDTYLYQKSYPTQYVHKPHFQTDVRNSLKFTTGIKSGRIFSDCFY